MFDAAEIARLEESRQSRGVASVADLAEPIAGGFMCFAGPGSWANQAMGLGMSGPVADADIDRLIDFYASRGVEPRIELCPHADPSLVRGLADRSFVIREFKNVLVRDLSLPLPAMPDGIRVTRVDPTDERQIARYSQIRAEGFGETNAPTAARLDRRSLAGGRVAGWLASIDGEDHAIASGAVAIDPPVAGLFGMTTLPPFRRRGCQRAMMIARLRAAADAGCRFATIHSEPHIGTGRNALRLGFTVVYTKVTLVRPGEGLLPSP